MLRLSALALGPLLARAAPKIGGGRLDHSTTIHNWLTLRFADPRGRFAATLTRTADRSWRALEIALAGEPLVRAADEADVDRALVEQLRQFVEVAPLPELTDELRRRLGAELCSARESNLIPGPIPSSDALASQVLRFLVGTPEESSEADARELACLAPKFRAAGCGGLADFLEAPTHTRPLLATAARYFFSREVADDLRLLRDLRFTRVELLADSMRAGFDRLADSLDRFTSVIHVLLKDLAGVPEPIRVGEPPLELPPPPPLPPPSAPIETGFSVHGVHLVAPIRPAADGTRAVPCPVCLTVLPVTKTGGWVIMRCASCGTEFQATDGSRPPPPPPAAPDPPDVKVLARNLRLWKASGEARRWVDGRKGLWTETDFRELCQHLRISHFWPMDPDDVRRLLVDFSTQSRTNGTGWDMTFPPVHPIAPPPPLLSTPGLIRTSEVYRTIDGNRWVRCPLCRSFNVSVPPMASGMLVLTCTGCSRPFAVDLTKKPPSPARSPSHSLPLPPPPPPTLWKKVCAWFGC